MAEVSRPQRTLWETVNASWPAIVGILTAVALGVLSLPALQSSRPPEGDVRKLQIIGMQDVDARLWQDPLSVVQDHLGEDDEGEVHALPHLLSQLNLDDDAVRFNKSPRDVLVLPVMIGGAPYAEDHESRLRARAAVTSALGRAHYTPSDGEHIGYVAIPDWPRMNKDINDASRAIEAYQRTQLAKPPLAWPGKRANIPSEQPTTIPTTGPSTIQLRIPYEWWSVQGLPQGQAAPAGEVRKPAVLVLWLREEAIADLPLSRLGMLLDQLRLDGQQDRAAGPVVRMIGPQSSSTLRAMVLEAARSESRSAWGSLRGLPVYSASATAADNVLTYQPEDPAPSDRNLSAGMRRSARQILKDRVQVELLRTLATDDMLSDALLEELRLRGVDVRGSGPAIALVSEWDTTYGRALPPTLISRALMRAPKLPGRDQCVNDPIMREMLGRMVQDWRYGQRSGFLQYSYLRGLDGMVPGKNQAKGEPNPQGQVTARDLEFARAPRELPEGVNQSDYLRRLAGLLVQEDQWLKRQTIAGPGAGEGIAAVGILGSDVYDKLMVLTALRHALPGVLFFTTDLDARLEHPTQWAAAHNLIVASSYGLRLRRDLQMDIPPFRDGYQTSLFFTTLLALHVLDPAADDTPPAARVFEIGRDGARDLSQPTTRPSTVVGFSERAKRDLNINAIFAAALQQHEDGVHPSPPYDKPWWLSRPRRWLGAAILWMSAMLMLLAHRDFRVQKFRWQLLFKFPYPYLILVLPAIVLLILILAAHDERHNEPLALSAGISIWPSEALRLFALALGLFFLCKGACDLSQNACGLARQFKLFSFRHRPGPRRVDLGLARHSTSKWRYAGRTELDATEFWGDYLCLASGKRPAARIALMSFAYFIGAIGLSLIFRAPHVPYRGLWSRNVDIMVLLPAVITQIVLIFFVVDATRLCERMILNLTALPVNWPGDLAKSEARSRGLKAADVDKYLAIRLIAQHTAVVGRLILYPFLVLLIMILARLSYFDNWDWPASLVVIFFVNFSYAIYCQTILFRAAATARKQSMARLSRQIAALDPATDSDQIRKLKQVVDDIRTVDQGSFAPLTQQPLATVLLSTGGLAIFQALAQWIIKT